MTTTSAPTLPVTPARVSGHAARLEALGVSAWFGSNKVLERVSLTMPERSVTALIGPSGCGKSTFLRILNRLHESVPSAALAGEVRLNGDDIYAPGHRITETRKRIAHATCTLDAQTLLEIVASIQENHPVVAKFLTRTAEQLDFDVLHQLMTERT